MTTIYPKFVSISQKTRDWPKKSEIASYVKFGEESVMKITCKSKITESIVGVSKMYNYLIFVSNSDVISHCTYYTHKRSAKRSAVRIAQRLGLFLKWKD